MPDTAKQSISTARFLPVFYSATGGEDWNGNTTYSGMPQDAFDSREHDSSEKELVK